MNPPLISPYPASSSHTYLHTHRPEAIPDPNSSQIFLTQPLALEQESKEQLHTLFEWPTSAPLNQSGANKHNKVRKPRDDWKQPVKPSLHLPVLKTLINQSNSQSTKNSPSSTSFPPLTSPHSQCNEAEDQSNTQLISSRASEPRPLNGIYEYTSAFEQSLNLKTGADAIAYFSRYGNQSTVKFVYANRANPSSASPYSFDAVLPDDFRPYDLVIVDQKSINPIESFTISPSGITCLSLNQSTEVMSLDAWIHQSNLFNLLRKIRFFKHFLLLKFFQNWKKNIRYRKFCSLRSKLSGKLFYARPSFCSSLIEIHGVFDAIQSTPISSLRPSGYVYSVDSFLKDKSDDLYGGVKKMESLIDRLSECVENVCRGVKDRARMFDHRIANEELSASRFAQHSLTISNKLASNKHISMVQAKQDKKNKKLQLAAANTEADRLGEYVRLIDCMHVDCLFNKAINDTRGFLAALRECKKPLFGTTVTFAEPSAEQLNAPTTGQLTDRPLNSARNNESTQSVGLSNNPSVTPSITPSPHHSTTQSLDQTSSQSLTPSTSQTLPPLSQDGLVYSPTCSEICTMLVHARDLSLVAFDSLTRVSSHPKFVPFLMGNPVTEFGSDEPISISSLVHVDIGFRSMMESINSAIIESFEGVHSAIKFISKHRVIADYGRSMSLASVDTSEESITSNMHVYTREMQQLSAWSSQLTHIRDLYSYKLSQADLRTIKQCLLPICEQGQSLIKAQLTNLFTAQCEVLLTCYASISSSTRDEPVLLSQYVDFCESIAHITQQESLWAHKITELMQLCDLLKTYAIYQTMRPADQVKYEQVLESKNTFHSAILPSLHAKIESKNEEMKQKLMSEIKRCESLLDALNRSIDEVTCYFDPSASLRDVFVALESDTKKWKDMAKKIEECSRQQRVLEDTQHNYKQFALIGEKLEKKRTLFTGLEQWREKEKKWNFAEIERLDVESMEHAYKQWQACLNAYQVVAKHTHAASERLSEREKKDHELIKYFKQDSANYAVLIPILNDLKFVHQQLGADGYKATFAGLFGNLKRVKDLKKLDWANNTQLRTTVQQKVAELKANQQ